jgi:hypothetical protein
MRDFASAPIMLIDGWKTLVDVKEFRAIIYTWTTQEQTYCECYIYHK